MTFVRQIFLAAGIGYDAKVAAMLARENLTSRLNGGPWRGTSSTSDAEKRDGRFARALDEGGQTWEGKCKYRSLEEVSKALDRGIADWPEEHEGEGGQA